MKLISEEDIERLYMLGYFPHQGDPCYSLDCDGVLRYSHTVPNERTSPNAPYSYSYYRCTECGTFMEFTERDKDKCPIKTAYENG